MVHMRKSFELYLYSRSVMHTIGAVKTKELISTLETNGTTMKYNLNWVAIWDSLF